MRRPVAQFHRVTGATPGICRKAARALEITGARVVLTAQDAARGAAVVEVLRQYAGDAADELARVDFV